MTRTPGPGLHSWARQQLQRRGRLPLWVMPLAVLLLAVGCSQGNYPFDYFSEMHYQASFRAQEPPRKAPPTDSVPTTGKELRPTADQLRTLRNPFTRSQGSLDRGKALFQTNCAMCHGSGGKGDGPVATRFKAANASTLPADLSLPATQSKAEGELWGIITNGGLNMPTFRALLTEEERWLLVLFIQSLR